MSRLGLFCFNVLFGAVAGTACGLLLGKEPMGFPALSTAFLHVGIAGLVVGTTVGLGAIVGPRPPLKPSRCLFAQATVALSSGVGGYIGSLFPQVVAEADQAVNSLLANRGIVVGSWFGAVAGTLFSIVHVYLMRRRAATRSK
jgi:hypothetical protein